MPGGQQEPLRFWSSRREATEPCVVGEQCQPVSLKEGEILIYTGKAAIRVNPDGIVNVTGALQVNGRSVLTEG